MIARRGVASSRRRPSLPLQMEANRSPASKKKKKEDRPLLNENCGFDCEQIAARPPNASRQLFTPGETRFRLYIIRGESQTPFE